ncbi:MAG: carboxypeptidase-like regulatory domain-containing protein [Candidatus Omnitrophota bacterium]
MNAPNNMPSKSPTSHLHVVNLVVALLAGVISITGGIYTLKNNVFSGPAYGSLQGIVRDERIAKPLKLASVEVADLTGAVVNTATTDDNGHYLIEALKTGNYVVKFTAPLHKIESKTIKIEKDLSSSISVDLFPEAQQANLSPVESVAVVPRNIQASYAPQAAYPPTAPVMSGYNVSKSNPSVPTASPTYSQTEPGQDPALSGSQRTGYRRHPRRSYPAESVESSTGTSQSSSQGDALAQVGTQLLQAWMSKKSSTTSSSTTSNGSGG